MSDEFRILTENERVRIAHLIETGRLFTGAGLNAKGHSTAVEVDPDGVLVIVTRTRLDTSIYFDNEELSCSAPKTNAVPALAMSFKPPEGSTVRRRHDGQDVKIGGA